MPSIARGETNTVGNLNWFTSLNSVLTDMYSCEFRIFSITSGLPGSQIFPDSGWEDVSSSPGKFDTGSYYAYDNSEAAGWTPEDDADLGTYRIYWRWKLESGSLYQTGAEDFEVTSDAVETTADWLTLQDLYNLIGSARVLQLFDDPVVGSLGSENELVQNILRAAEGEAYSRMMRAWTTAEIEAMAGVDISFRNHVAWVALEFASERRPAFAAADGKGAFWAQYERAIAHFDGLAKNKIRSKGESAAGRAGTSGGNLRPTDTAKTSASFVFAPSQENPSGSGGF